MTLFRSSLFGLALLAITGSAFAGPPPGLEPGVREGPPPRVVEEVKAHETEILAWVQENDPTAYRRLIRVRDTDPRGYIAQLVRVSRLMRLAEADPAVVERHQAIKELERQIRTVAADWSSLDAKTQKERRGELEQLAGQLLELKQAERRARLEEIRARAAELEAEIEERDANRKQVIEAWLDDLLEEDPSL